MLSFEIGIYKGGYWRAWSILDFPITNIWIFSPRVLDVAIPVKRTLPCFSPEQRLPRKCKDFDGSAS